MSRFNPRIEQRVRIERIFAMAVKAATGMAVVALVVLLAAVSIRAAGWLDWKFLTSFPAPYPEEAGFLPAIAGSLWLVLLAAPLSIMLGVLTAIYLEEYSQPGRLRDMISTNISNLAGVPSIVYGILGLVVFVRYAGFGGSLLSAALTMALLVLPLITVSSQEAIRNVPRQWREAAYALGASKWQVIRRVVLPAALPGILTGSILAVGRLLGETAPLLAIGAFTYVAFIPTSPLDGFTVMPIQIYTWTTRPKEEFRSLAAAGIVVMLIVLLATNALAIWLRNRYQYRVEE